MFSSAKHPVLTGTAILTCAGTLSRLIGFFYRIFLSRTIGAQGLGIYQMIFPVYALLPVRCHRPAFRVPYPAVAPPLYPREIRERDGYFS